MMPSDDRDTTHPSRTAAPAPLAQMKETMARILEALTQQEECNRILLGGRELLSEAASVIHTQLTEITAMLRRLETPLAQAGEPGAWWDAVLKWGGYGLAAVLILWQVWGFFHPPETFEAFAGSLNTAVEQTYTQLPKSAQDLFAAAYRKHGYQVPGQAKGTK
jgi:hypothetical protein